MTALMSEHVSETLHYYNYLVNIYYVLVIPEVFPFIGGNVFLSELSS